MAQKPRLPSMTAEQIKSILRDVLSAFEEPDNRAKIDQVQEDAGSDLVKLMQHMIPVATHIQQQVIKGHAGFTSSQQGLLKFTQMVHFFAKDDPEIEKMANQLRTKFIPLMPSPPVFVSQEVTEQAVVPTGTVLPPSQAT